MPARLVQVVVVQQLGVLASELAALAVPSVLAVLIQFAVVARMMFLRVSLFSLSYPLAIPLPTLALTVAQLAVASCLWSTWLTVAQLRVALCRLSLHFHPR